MACADKLDTIAGIFAIGEPPTGSSDPYALRRAAIGIINILRDRLPIDPTTLIDFALELYSEQGIEFDAAEVAQQVREFFHGRLVSMARDEKIPADTVAAVSAVHIIAPSVFFARCAALDEARKINKHADLGDLVNVDVKTQAFGRIAAQTAKQVIIQGIRESERGMAYNEYKIGRAHV